MDKHIFTKRKEELTYLLMDKLNSMVISIDERHNLDKLLSLINEYTFENRFIKKGLLTHTIIDSIYAVDSSITDKFIYFDEHIK